MKKKKIYVNKINEKIGNNQTSYEIKEEDNIKDNLVIKNNNIEDKLEELFSTNGYIFNVNVKIVTDDKTYDTKIASRIGDNIITLDNDVIRIDDIKDIIF